MKTMSRTIAALGLLLSAFAATSASAAIITYDFSVVPGEGPLAGNTYNGSLSYNDAAVTPGFTGTLNQASGSLTVSFTFEGTTYTQADDSDYPNYPQIGFSAGVFQGLSFLVTLQFSIGLDADDYVSAGTDFSYIGSEEFTTLNAVTYTLHTNEQAVPEPATLAVLGAGLFGLGMIRRRQSRA